MVNRKINRPQQTLNFKLQTFSLKGRDWQQQEYTHASQCTAHTRGFVRVYSLISGKQAVSKQQTSAQGLLLDEHNTPASHIVDAYLLENNGVW